MTNPTRGDNFSLPADETRELGFYNPHDGVKGRDGGPYLDFVEREAAEKIRAQREDREPETGGNVPAVAGTPLVVASQLTDNSFTSNPSRRNAPGLETAINDDTFNDGDYLADPVSRLEVNVGTETPDDQIDPTRNDGPSGSPAVASGPQTATQGQVESSGGEGQRILSDEDRKLAGEVGNPAGEDPASY